MEIDKDFAKIIQWLFSSENKTKILQSRFYEVVQLHKTREVGSCSVQPQKK